AHIVTIALSVFFHGSPDHRDLPSFPTRRSSDLNEGIERRIGQSCERARIAEPLPQTLERRVQELPPAVGRDAGLDALASRAPEPQLRVGAERALVLEIEAPRAAGERQSGSPGAPRGVDERLREALAAHPRGEPRAASRERLRCGPGEQWARQELQVLG